MPRSSSAAARCSETAVRDQGIRQCQAFVNASQRPRQSSMPGVRQRQSKTKAFVNARRSSMPAVRQRQSETKAFVNAIWRMPTFGPTCCFVHLCSKCALHLCYVCKFRCTQNLSFGHLCSHCALHLCSVCKASLLCASVTIFMSPTWDALLTPVLVRHPGNAFELVSKRLRGQQSPRVCTLTPTVTIINKSFIQMTT